jgi:PAS domain S-box-containing protein
MAPNHGIQHCLVMTSVDEQAQHGLALERIGIESSVFDSIASPIFAVDRLGNVTDWNETLADLSGFASLDVVRRPAELMLDGCVDTWREALQTVQRAKRSFRCMLRLYSNQSVSTSTWYAARISRYNSYEGILIGAVCMLDEETQTFDMGKHIHVQDLRPNDTKGYEPIPDCDSRELLGGTNILIIKMDKHGRVDLWNKVSTEITGVTERDARGENISVFLTESSRKAFSDVMDKALSGEACANYQLEFLTKDGCIRYLLGSVTPRTDLDGSIAGCLVIAQDVTETAIRERTVTATALELRNLIDTANVAIFGVDCDGYINEWNDTMANTCGFTGDEAFHKSFVHTFIAQDLRPAFEVVLEIALQGKFTKNYEAEILTKLGEIRYLLLNTTARRNSENEIIGVVLIAQDVTEEYKHDRAVAAMASELRQLIDTANAPIFGIDCEGDVNEWNDKTSEITGYTKEEAFDCCLVETFIVPSMQESVRHVLETALKGRGTSNYDLEFRTKSNEIRHLLVNATTRRDAENNIVGVVGVAQDVTEAVQRDRAVAGMALELRQLIDTANAPIFGIDIDGNVNEWNRRTQEITGYSKEETFDEPLVERFIAKHMRKKVQEILDSALQGIETSNYELEFLSKSGEPAFMLVNATTRRDPEFNVVGVVGVAQDVTEDRKHAEELRKMQYLQALQEAKVETERNMTAYFAHELRNPLGAIDSALSVMPENIPDSAKSLVSGMQLCCSFMSSIMNNLLDVRKMEEGKMTLNKTPISLKALSRKVHKMLGPSVKPGVTFTESCTTNGKDWVLGDEHRLQQVMTNVITNAIKYTVGGSISIYMGWEGDDVKFECVDTGPGIPKREQEKLFQRFVMRGGAPGTGLGLAIAKHLVDLAGGSIRFDSDPSIQAGTACIVLLPLALCDPPEEGNNVIKMSLLDEPLLFLVIDDVRMNRTMLKRRLQTGIAPNCVLTEASTGEEALQIVGKQTFDVIIVDQYMEEAGGVMVGTDVVYAMRRMKVEALIIGCSGNDLYDEFHDAGADWVWQKPIPTNATIINRLREALLTKKLLASKKF